MAVMKLADLISHQEFTDYLRLAMVEKSTLIKSGIAAPDPVISAKVAAGSGMEGKTLDMPALESLDNMTAEIPVEDTGATAQKIGTVNDTAVVQYLRAKQGVTDVAKTMGNVDPILQIASQLAEGWRKIDNGRFISLVKGVFAANDRKARVSSAGDSDAENDTNGYFNGGDGDMTYDITSAATDSAKMLAKDTLLMGAQKMGDRSDELTAVAMNSATAAYLASIDMNAGLYRASEGPGQLAKYNGRDIIVDDTIPYDATNKTATIYLFGRGVAAYNELPVPNAIEYDRDVDKASNYIHTWRRFIMHIRGMKWIGTMAGLGPTDAELYAATSWKRVYAQKRIPLVRVIAKIG